MGKTGGIRWSFDTIPHILTILLGLAITFAHSIIMGIIHISFIIGGMIWFLAFICTRCRAFGHVSCPSGYGHLAKALFGKKKGDFGKAFKRNIFSVAIQWFFPLGVGIYDLLFHPEIHKMVLLALFILVAFVYLPIAARRKGCGSCPQKNECPFKK